jgi:hypothetical protein
VSEPTTSGSIDLRLHVGRFSLDPHAIIYGTIILMTAYALYDEGTDPLGKGPLAELVAISFAPLFALAMAHMFSESLDLQIRNGHRLDAHDRRHLLASNVQYLYVAIPPTILMTIMTIMTWDANTIIEVLQVLGLISLSFWGVFAARKAGLNGRRQLGFAISYGLMGLFVILVELAITH